MAFFGLTGLANRMSRAAGGGLTRFGRAAAGVSRGYRGAIYGAGAAYSAADPIWNSTSSLAIRALMGLGAARAVSDYSEGNFQSPLTQALAGATSFGLTWSAYRDFGRAGTRLGSSFLRGVEQSRLTSDRAVMAEVNAGRASLTKAGAGVPARVAGVTRSDPFRIPFLGRLPGAPMGMRTSTTYNAYGGMARELELGGRVDRFLAAAGPLSAAAVAARYANRYGAAPVTWAARTVGGFPVAAVTGRVGYTKAIGGAIARGPGGPGFMDALRGRAGGYGTVASSWYDFFGDIGRLPHPYAPVMMTGAVIGAAGAWMERRSPFSPSEGYYGPLSSGRAFAPWSWNARSVRPVGVGGGPGAVNQDLFGMGIEPGGASAVKSQDVMEGQAAVTMKMITNRRV